MALWALIHTNDIYIAQMQAGRESLSLGELGTAREFDKEQEYGPAGYIPLPCSHFGGSSESVTQGSPGSWKGTAQPIPKCAGKAAGHWHQARSE